MANSLADCDDMVELDVVRRGYLHIKRPPTNRKIRLKTWQRRYFILREARSKDSGATLEIYTDEPGRDENAEIGYVVNLSQVTHVQEYTESRSFPHAFVVIRARKSPLTFGAHTSQEMREWYVAIKLLADRQQPPSIAPRSGPPSPGRLSPRLCHSNRSTPSPDVRRRWDSNSSERESPLVESPRTGTKMSHHSGRPVNGHIVRVRTTPDAIRNRLSGEYVMAVEGGVVTLRRPGPQTAVGGGVGGGHHVSWPLSDICKFKNDELPSEHLITIEASGSCGKLQGTYLFRIDCGRELIREVREHVSNHGGASAQPEVDARAPSTSHGGRVGEPKHDAETAEASSYLTVIPQEPPPPLPIRAREPSPKSTEGRVRTKHVKEPSIPNGSPKLKARSPTARDHKASSLTPPSRTRQQHGFKAKTSQNESLSVPDVSIAGVSPLSRSNDSKSSSASNSSKRLDLSVEVPAPVKQINGSAAAAAVTHAPMERQVSVDLDTFFVLPDDDDDDSPPDTLPALPVRKTSLINQSLSDLPAAAEAKDEIEGYIDLSGSCSDMSETKPDESEYVLPSHGAISMDSLDYVVSVHDSDENTSQAICNLEYFVCASDSEESNQAKTSNLQTSSERLAPDDVEKESVDLPRQTSPTSAVIGEDKRDDARCSDEEKDDSSINQPMVTSCEAEKAMIASDGFRAMTSSEDNSSRTTCIVSTAFTVAEGAVLPDTVLPVSLEITESAAPPIEDAPPPPLPTKQRSTHSELRGGDTEDVERRHITPRSNEPKAVQATTRKVLVESCGKPTDGAYLVKVDRPPTASFAVIDVSTVDVNRTASTNEHHSLSTNNGPSGTRATSAMTDKFANEPRSVVGSALQQQQQHAPSGSSQYSPTGDSESRVDVSNEERFSKGMTAEALFGMTIDGVTTSSTTTIQGDGEDDEKELMLPKRRSLQECENKNQLSADVQLPIAVHSLGRKTGKMHGFTHVFHQKRHFVDKDVELEQVVEAQWSAFQAAAVPQTEVTPPPLPPRLKPKGAVSQPVVRVQCSIGTSKNEK